MPLNPTLPYMPPIGALPGHIRYDGLMGMSVNPKAFGARGALLNPSNPNEVEQFITEEDTQKHPEWWTGNTCRYTAVASPYYDSDRWDYVGIMEACRVAYGTPDRPHGLYSPDNREVLIPGGNYYINKPIKLYNSIGTIFRGAGRFSTTIHQMKKNMPVLDTGMCYSVIKDLYFNHNGGDHDVETAQVEWNWDGGGFGSPQGVVAGLAQLSIYDCIFHGNQWGNTTGFRVTKDLYQGDNVVFHNCFFAASKIAGFNTGQGAFNALNMCFYTCNFQSCFNVGIQAYGGNIIVLGGSFQNGTFDSNPPQTGFDIRLVSNAGSVCSIIHGCRSESKAFLHADSFHNVDVRGCSNLVGPIPWAPNTYYSIGRIVRARDASPDRDGKPYVCVDPGTSAPTGEEPVWGGSSKAVIDGNARWAKVGPDDGAAVWVTGTYYAVGDIVRGAAQFDGNKYICVVAGHSAYPASAEPTWAYYDTSGIEDNPDHPSDGGPRWAVYDYNTIEFDAGSLFNSSFPWGRIKIQGTAPVEITHCVFSRKDWLWKGQNPIASPIEVARTLITLSKNIAVHGGGINQGSSVPYSFETYSTEPDHVEAYAHYYHPSDVPFLFPRNCHRAGTMHRGARDVGLWPSRGHYADGTNEDISTNVLGNIGALGPRHAPEVENAPGEDQIIQGGLSRGTGKGGDIRLRVNAPAEEGSSVLNFPHPTLDSLRVRYNRVLAGVPLQVLKVSMSQRDALTDKEPGDQIYNITLARLQVWNGWTWDDLSPGTVTWDPLTYFGVDLKAWWQIKDPATRFQDSALTTLATATGHPLGGIADKTPNLRHLLQATTTPTDKRPTLQLGVTAGHPVARHDGLTQYLQTAPFARPEPDTMVVIFRGTNGNVMDSGTNLTGAIFLLPGGGQVLFYHGVAVAVNQNVGTRFGCAIATLNGANSKLWVNGVRDDLYGPPTAADPALGITMGARYEGSSQATFDWCEAFLVGRELTDLERDYIGLYGQQYDTPEPYLNS